MARSHSQRWCSLLIAAWLVAGSNATAQPVNDDTTRFFTQAQVTQGAEVFKQSCAACHTVDTPGALPDALVGKKFIRRWHSVADLYHRSRWMMPADAVLSLEVDAYLAVTAYLLNANGFQPGKTPLVEDDAAMKKMVLFPVDPALSSSANSPADGFYTAAQAARGMHYFEGSCGTCHSVTPPAGVELERAPGMGIQMGSYLMVLPLDGNRPLFYRDNVGDFYLKSRTSMPVEYPNGLSEQSYLDIVAYVLQAKGLPAGPNELTADLAAMRAMTLVEEGFTPLFNGQDLSGFKFLLGNACTPAPQGCGSTQPGTTFTVNKGAIHISGRPSGYLYTEHKYLDFTLRLDMRYLPYDGMESAADYYNNTGIVLFITEHQVWPKSLEVQGLYREALSILPIDNQAKFTFNKHLRDTTMRPLGEWNSIEIVSRAGEVQVSVNGLLVTTVTEHEFKLPGHIGVQSEGAEVYLRNIRIREE